MNKEELQQELIRETIAKQQWHEEYVKQKEIVSKLEKENEELKDKIRDIVDKSYNDIDYFNRDIRKDVENLLKESEEKIQ